MFTADPLTVGLIKQVGVLALTSAARRLKAIVAMSNISIFFITPVL
jgi:hypothetical protein